ncbi:hypothetical protein U9M48_023767 [Paspalum notatum var. saurae]|uniref:Uncharacterized protein n=1 Tax=Paspalum notatum var. saurae TaxID=547442 RepID=A0AAQ3TKD5_PASNO
MVVPSLNRPRQATPDPLSALALLEDKQKFKLGGYQNAHKTAENTSRIEDELTGRPTLGLVA